MKKNKIKISFIIMIIWVAVIFAFSLQPAKDSSRLSLGVGYFLTKLLPGEISETILSLRPLQLSFLHTLLRKAGHFTEYFILGMLSINAFLRIEFSYKKWLGLWLCILVAAMDETIQLFVSGRSGQITDVLLDSVGALCGILIVLLIRKLIGSGRNKI